MLVQYLLNFDTLNRNLGIAKLGTSETATQKCSQ